MTRNSGDGNVSSETPSDMGVPTASGEAIRKRKTLTRAQSQSAYDCLNIAMRTLQTPDDEFTTFSNFIAVELRQMPPVKAQDMKRNVTGLLHGFLKVTPMEKIQKVSALLEFYFKINQWF